jgi:glycosyltransferase involved in cell wall biosynthesis
MTDPILTFVVPTFNRPKELARLFDGLGGQRDPRVRILVLDNHSEYPARDIVPADIEVVRHTVNIGSHGNFTRAFEIVQTPWIWICGDDDILEPDAIQRALSAIAQHPDAAVIAFAYAEMNGAIRAKSATYTDVVGFADGIDHIFPTIWVSRTLYRREAYIPFISQIYNYSIGAVHFAVTLLALTKNLSYVSIPEIIVRNATNDDGWNMLDVRVMMTNMLDLTMNAKERLAVARALRRSFTISGDIKILVQLLNSEKYQDEILTMFSSAWAPVLLACRDPIGFFIVIISSILLRISILRRGLRAGLRLAGYKPLPDRLRYVPRGYRI